jgi:dolichol-phosphate mannosyltransferase
VQAVGWTSTVVLLSFMFGVVISCIGIVGLYVGRIFEQTKDRPVFIIDSTTSSFPGSRGG